jgi:SHS2 domain-containing protein
MPLHIGPAMGLPRKSGPGCSLHPIHLTRINARAAARAIRLAPVDFLFAARICRIVIARWEHFPHGADMGVRGFGATKAEAFEQAALAMTAVVTDTTGVEARETVRVACEAPDDELLLAEWLNSLIYEMATRKMLFSRFAVQIDGTRLSAQAWGERADVARHHPAVEIKGATYTALRVARDDSGWVAQTVVDV